jgi:AdoMet-dependent heme synthase
LYRLESVDLNVTRRCNLACTFCSVDVEKLSSRSPELTLADIDRLFFQFEGCGVSKVRLVGGEPFARSDICEILELSSRFRFQTSVLTNATILRARHVEKMKSCNISHVAISVDGHTPELHDSSRGQTRAFVRMLNAVRLCREAGVPLRMMTAVTGHNIGHLRDLVDFSERQGFDLVNFIVLGLNGPALENRENFPRYDVWSKAIVDLTRYLDARGPHVFASILFPHENPVPRELYEPLAKAGLEDLVEKIWGFDLSAISRAEPGRSTCRAGHDGVAILPNGDVYGCDLMQDIPEFRAGNIHEKPVAEIFHSSQVFAELRRTPAVTTCAQFDQDSTDFSCGQCRAGIRNLLKSGSA